VIVRAVPKHVRRLSGFDEAVISLYAKGMTTGDIAAHLAEVYDTHVHRVEVWLPEAAWSGGLSAMSTVYADLFLVMNLSGRRTGWTLESDWLLERLSLPAGSDAQEVIALASPAIATLFRRGRGSGPAHLSESALAAALASVFAPEALAQAIDDALSGLTGDQKMAFARS
jgi:hypothetical protein